MIKVGEKTGTLGVRASEGNSGPISNTYLSLFHIYCCALILHHLIEQRFSDPLSGWVDTTLP
jgi:hypothetical protein